MFIKREEKQQQREEEDSIKSVTNTMSLKGLLAHLISSWKPIGKVFATSIVDVEWVVS